MGGRPWGSEIKGGGRFLVLGERLFMRVESCWMLDDDDDGDDHFLKLCSPSLLIRGKFGKLEGRKETCNERDNL